MQNVRVALAQIAPMLGEVEENLALHARTACPLLRDERIELVYRELERIRASRFGLDESDGGSKIPREEVDS